MQSFPVICETCRARLKIRDASAIGEIHACPRCGGMVHIVPPADWSPEAANDSAPAEATAGAPAALPSSLPTIAAAPESQAASEQFTDFAVDESLLAPPTVVASAPDVAHVPSAVDVALAPPGSSAMVEELLAEPGFGELGSTELAEVSRVVAPIQNAPMTFIQSALARPILLYGGAAAMLAFTGGFTAAVLMMNDGDVEPPLASTTTTITRPSERPSNASTEENPYRVAAEEERARNEAAVEVAAAESARGHKVARPVIEEADLPDNAAAPFAGAPALPELPPEEPPSSDVAVAAKPAEDVPAESSIASSDVPDVPPPSAPVAEPKPVLKLDPLSFDPLALGFSLSDSSNVEAAQNSIADQAAQSEPLSPPDEEHIAEANHVDDGLALARRGPEEEQTVTVGRGPAGEDGRALLDIKQRLMLPVKSIELTKLPLSRFVEAMAELAGTPITLDPAALVMAGASPREEVSVRARNTTLEKLLRVALKEERLDVVERGGQLVVVRPNIEKRRTVSYELKDLIGAGNAAADAGRLAKLLERFVAPESWQSAGGEGVIVVDGTQLRVEQSHGVHYDALVFFERLRMARNLAPRSSYPANLLSIESPYAELAAPLGESTTFTFLPWTPITEVVRHWEDATGLTILVDWSALADIALEPTSTISCSAIDRTWDEAFSAILEPLDLAWRAVDGQTLQITSQSAAEEIRTIEFYSLSPSLRDQFASPGALAESLAAEIEKEVADKAGTSPPAIELEIDAVSGRLIALGNADVHRYLTKRLRETLDTTTVRATPVTTN